MSEQKSSRLGLTDYFAVAFVVLKLCHVIDWSWWWVTAPIWGGIVLGVILTMAQNKGKP